MSNDRKVYDKGGSVQALSRKGEPEDNALRRIGALRSSLADVPTSREEQVVQQACDDLLNSAGDQQEHQFYLRPHVVEELAKIKDEELPRYLFYRYRYDVLPATKQVDEFPPCLQIEPASICNYRCVFCFQTDSRLTAPSNGHMGLMKLDLFKSVVDQAHGRCEAITLASRGEPLICKDIEKMLDYVHGKFLAFKVNTNGWFLDERKAHAILAADTNCLVFSVDAAEEPLYSQLRVNGNLERVKANIELFHRIRERDYPDSRTITRISGVNFSAEQNFESMRSMWSETVDQVAFVDYNPWENVYDKDLSGVDAVCSDLYRRMFVWFDGTVNPCDVDYLSTLSVGNAGDAELSDMWKGAAYSTLREAHVGGRRCGVTPCNGCTVV